MKKTIGIVAILIVLGVGLGYVAVKTNTTTIEADNIPQNTGDITLSGIIENTGIVNNSETITSGNIDTNLTIKANNLPKDWTIYNNEKLGLKFGYPKNWFVYEKITDSNKRIYIENKKDENADGPNPVDFLMIWIDYREPSNKTIPYEEELKMLNTSNAKKTTIKSNGKDIYLYEYAFDLNSERSGVGPYLEALWENNGMTFNAQTREGSNKKYNEKTVAIFKTILSTITLKQ